MEAMIHHKSSVWRPLSILAITALFISVFIIILFNNFPVLLSILSFILLIYIFLCSIKYSLSVVALRSKYHDMSQVFKDMPFVSVIVPAYNEGPVLKRTIPTMLRIEYPENKIEFLYVYERKSTDDTEEVILSYAKKDSRIRPLLRVSDKGGKAAATNYGIKHARGEIIASFDADHSVSSKTILRAVSWFWDPRVKCVKGRCRGINKRNNLLTMISGIERDIVERLSIPSTFYLKGFSTFGGGHAYFRKTIFRELGLFDEEIMTEDIDYSVRLHLKGYEVVCDPMIESWEELPNHFGPWFQQRVRWARGWMQVWSKHIKPVLSNKMMKRYEKFDIAVTLTMVLGIVISIFLIPTMVLNFLGKIPAIVPRMYYVMVVAFATLIPLILAVIVVYIDYIKDRKARWLEIPSSLLLIPYFFLLVGVSWLAFCEEFVIKSESVYVKTQRNDIALSKMKLYQSKMMAR